MSDVLEMESRDVPGPVGFAAIIGFGKAIFEIIFGIIGVAAANAMDDSFGGGILVFGIVYAIASYLLLRGSRFGYYLTVALSTLGLVVGVGYMFRSGGGIFAGTAAIVFFNAVVLYLLLGRKSSREFFGLGSSQ
jgi:uncharacterized membrane protein (UPF0136 family)